MGELIIDLQRDDVRGGQAMCTDFVGEAFQFVAKGGGDRECALVLVGRPSGLLLKGGRVA